MKIVINIDEKYYNDICDAETSNVYRGVLQAEAFDAVRNGTPLPKGHGDLIDRNELNKDLLTNEWITDDDGGGLEDIIFDTPAIIKADIEI